MSCESVTNTSNGTHIAGYAPTALGAVGTRGMNYEFDDKSAYRIVTSESEFEKYIAELLPQLLTRSTNHTKRFLRQTGQWENDIAHEKLAQRWAYELVERFFAYGRQEVPCRPLHLLDSFVSKHYSQPEGCKFNQAPVSALSRFLNGLLSKAVCNRDALTAVFYHLYGFDQQQVSKILALESDQTQRVYKSYMRWRSTGWTRMVEDEGLNGSDVNQILDQKRRNPARLNREVERLTTTLQAYYRKSEPAHYPCLSSPQWQELYAQDYGHDYRSWHLPLCQSCLNEVRTFRQCAVQGDGKMTFNLQVHPLQNRKAPGPLLVFR